MPLTGSLPSTVCAHPIHYHSFSRPSSVLSFVRSRFQTCVKCNQLLVQGSRGFGNMVTSADVVVCLACGVFAHRRCGVIADGWTSVCEVNGKLIRERKEFLEKKDIQDGDEEAENDDYEEVGITYLQEGGRPREKEEEKKGHSHNEDDQYLVNIANQNPVDDKTTMALSPCPPPPSVFSVTTPQSPNANITPTIANIANNKHSNLPSNSTKIWSANGPPAHWASPDALRGIKTTNTDELEGIHNDDVIEGTTSTNREASLARMSRALQENIFAHWMSRGFCTEYAGEECKTKAEEVIISKSLSNDKKDEKYENTDGLKDGNRQETKALMMEVSHHVVEQQEDSSSINEKEMKESKIPSREEDSSNNNNDDTKNNNNNMTILLNQKKPSAPPPLPPTKLQTTLQTAKQTRNLIKKTSQLPKAVGIASVAGGLAGGVAGLIISGPAGAYIGCKIGQYTSMVGVVLEGTISAGVLAASVAGTVVKVKQMKDGAGERRILAIGEKGVERKVVLVRPNIVVDPIWEEVTADARRSSLSPPSRIQGLVSTEAADARVRLKRDTDIAKADEKELGTPEKVLLLVSSSLNDKRSLPGHVYRHLIREHRKRENIRRKEDSRCKDNSSEKKVFCRTTREDTHAVIKHVTATLLDVRPGFGASPIVTEMTATAVELLVFGEVFDLVFGEIAEETREADQVLMTKISEFQNENARRFGDHSRNGPCDLEEFVSDDALNCLRMLPESHSVAEKLYHCVQFLEKISAQFNENPNVKKAMGADSLLKMVCQHIFVAKVPNLNAEIVFLEEFARDEQLLKGKEGYALVTMQASLHFMNASTDFGKDIFHEDD